MDTLTDKYFATKDILGFSVIYQDYSKEAGNFWALEKDGFETEEGAMEYATQLNNNG